MAAVTLCQCQRALIKHVSRSRDFARFQLTELRTFYTVTPEVKLKSHKLSWLTYLNSPLSGNYRASQTLVKNCSVNSSHVVTTGTEVNSAWAIPSWVGAWVPSDRHRGQLSVSHPFVSRRSLEYQVRAGGVNRHIAWYISPYPWSRSVSCCLAED